MTQPTPADPYDSTDLPTGPGAAAILAAGVGAMAVGLLSFAVDVMPGLKTAFAVWKASGPLSGVSSLAVIVWLAAWLVLHSIWRRRNVGMSRVNAAAFVMLAAGLLLTFPPFVDLLQGK